MCVRQVLGKAIAGCTRSVLRGVQSRSYCDHSNHSTNDQNPGSPLFHDIPSFRRTYSCVVRLSPSLPAIIPKSSMLGAMVLDEKIRGQDETIGGEAEPGDRMKQGYETKDRSLDLPPIRQIRMRVSRRRLKSSGLPNHFLEPTTVLKSSLLQCEGNDGVSELNAINLAVASGGDDHKLPPPWPGAIGDGCGHR